MWPIGQILEDRYRIEGCIGRGGTARVYRATRLDGAGEVAVKVIRRGPGWSAHLQARFEREVEIIATLDHPGAYPLFGAGRLIDGSPYLVTELIAGRTLDQVLRAERRLSQLVVVRMLLQLADVLAASHALGVVHRDIKPDNVVIELLLPDNCRVRLIDFGVARWPTRGSLTHEHTVVGCPRYMAPELALGHQATPQTDLYGLGMIAFEALCGRAPFIESSPLAHMMRHINEPPPSLFLEVPEVIRGVETLVGDLLAKSPADRPHGTRGLMQRLVDLEEVLDPGPAVRDTANLDPVRGNTLPMTPVRLLR